MERRSQLFWPLALIAAGILWILVQTGNMPAANLWALTYLWPLLLIGAGVSLILRPYRAWAAPVVSALVVAILFLAVLFAGQIGWDRVPGAAAGGRIFWGPVARGSGQIVSQARDVSGFTAVRLDYPASVLIRQGQSEALRIEAEDNVMAEISTQVVNGTLEIKPVRSQRLHVNPTEPVRITITVRDLKDVRCEAAGDITVQDLNAADLSVGLNGAGSINLDNARLKSLEAVLRGAGSLRASGEAESLRVELDGLGNFDGAGLRTREAAVSLNGMGSAEVWVESNLAASIGGLGSVGYYGSPQVSKSVSGLGSVHYLGAK